MDNRILTWQLLLPKGAVGHVLVLGASRRETEHLGCAQAWTFAAEESIITLSPKKFDTLLLMGPNWEEPDEYLGELLDRLDPDGTLVVMGFRGARVSLATLNRFGFLEVEQWSALPASNPRVFFPVLFRRTRSRGLNFHEPGSIRARRRLVIARLLCTLGWKLGATRHGVLLARKNPLREEMALKSWVSARLKCRVADLVLYAGSDTPHQKITALALDENRNDLAVLKVANTAAGTDAIRREVEALHALESTRLAAKVPTVLIEQDVWHGLTIHAQSVLKARGAPQALKPSSEHLRFLALLSEVSRCTVPVRETTEGRAIEHAMIERQPPIHSQVLSRALDRVSHDNLLRRMIPAHRNHGDFTPWNIRTNRGQFQVFDWEDSTPCSLPCGDLFRFYCASWEAGLTRPQLPARSLEEMLTMAQKVTSSHEMTHESLQLILFLWLLHQSLVRPPALYETLIENVLERGTFV